MKTNTGSAKVQHRKLTTGPPVLAMGAGVIVVVVLLILAAIAAGVYYWMYLRQKRQEDKVLNRVGEDPFAPGAGGPGTVWGGGAGDYVLIEDGAIEPRGGDGAHASGQNRGTAAERRTREEAQLVAAALDPAVMELRLYKNEVHKFDLLFPSGWAKEEAESTEAVCVQFSHELDLGQGSTPKYLRFSVSWDDVSFVSMSSMKFATNMADRLPRMVAGARILDVSPYRGTPSAAASFGGGTGTAGGGGEGEGG